MERTYVLIFSHQCIINHQQLYRKRRDKITIPRKSSASYLLDYVDRDSPRSARLPLPRLLVEAWIDKATEVKKERAWRGDPQGRQIHSLPTFFSLFYLIAISISSSAHHIAWTSRSGEVLKCRLYLPFFFCFLEGGVDKERGALACE